jgi:hypothetical protein
MWTPLRQEILRICELFGIPKERFKQVPIHEWQNIQDKILQTFCHTDLSGPIWERLKFDSFAVQFNYNYPFDQLSYLVPEAEVIWLCLNETVKERNKYWFFEGHINDIIAVLNESQIVDEVYIASRKYEWLLCVNHHNVIIATGNLMTMKLMTLIQSK